MNIIQKLTIKHLLLNKKRTFITIVGIMLSVAMLTAMAGFIVSFQDVLRRDAVASGGNWHISYKSISKEVSEQIANEPLFFESYVKEADDKNFNIFLLVKNPKQDVFEKSEEIAKKYDIPIENLEYHNSLLAIDGAFANQNYYDAFYWFAAILIAIIMTGSIIVISNAFYISSNERGRQFGMLISVGATKKQIRSSIIFEGLALAVIAIPLGLIAGFIVEWIALSIANVLLRGMIVSGFELRVIILPLAVLGSSALSFVTIILSAWFPARKASQVSAIDSIRQTKEIKINPKKVRTSPLTKALFGFEGVLASKALKRSKNKYRATVISLVVSIVLFVGVSSFGQLLRYSAAMAFEDYGFNVFIEILGQDTNKQDELANKLELIGDESFSRARRVTYKTNLADNVLTDKAKEAFSETTTLEGGYVKVYGIGTKEFEILCKTLNIKSDVFTDNTQVNAILINTTGNFYSNGRKYNIQPYNFKKDMELNLYSKSEDLAIAQDDVNVVIVDTINEIPKGIIPSFRYDDVNLIVSEMAFNSILYENSTPPLELAINTQNADDFSAQAEELLSNELQKNSYSVVNFEEAAKSTRNINLLIMVFVYGFIAMLSLIGVTSVIGTITTSISLRKQEFAMLQSVGMTQSGISKMLNLESLFYGINSLIIGLPMGLAVSFLLYKALGNALEFPYILPWQSILISIVTVMLITFSTMHYARAKQKGNNIIDSLRGDNN